MYKLKYVSFHPAASSDFTLKDELIDCVPGLILLDFKMPEMGLNFHPVIAPVTNWYSPRVQTDTASAILEPARTNDASGAIDDLELRLRHCLAVYFRTGSI